MTTQSSKLCQFDVNVVFTPCHLRLKERKALAARTIFYEMMEQHWPHYTSQDDNGLRDNFLRIANEELERESALALDTRLVNMVEDVEAGLKGFRRGKIVSVAPTPPCERR